ncbi:hypothetical protein PRK78_002313 [Emydomyces testavorans]|uniref:BZIP domain-containing protein n=1 Tax=Emydomyces testavorans TaxID=2070801 RepID=A0AAF0DEN0_9EURO|nr:hypothetical protein PRK78_002313 [Emydomyces testavorans]
MLQPDHASKSARIRDNQRRSRARRKEYIQDLERRLQKFEKLGVEATLEVQAAGRKVAEENLLLRSLLRLRGVTDVDVEEYLRVHGDGRKSDGGGGGGGGVSAELRPSSSSMSRLVQGDKAGEGRVDHAMTKRRGLKSAQGYSHMDGLGSEERMGGVQPARRWEAGPSSGAVRNGHQPRTRTPSCDGLTATDGETSRECNQKDELYNEFDAAQVTSCETAARIITMMRGDPDTRDARTELGCAPGADCVVKNMTIFEILDR